MRDPGNNVTYLHSDHLGSTSATSGANPGFQVYFPFGSPRAGNLPTDYGFTGQKLDASDGLMYYGARYYDAALGRFISADTIVPNAGNPQSLNRYAYVLNNPIRLVDPSGHCPIDDEPQRCGIKPSEDDGVTPPPPPPGCRSDNACSSGSDPSNDPNKRVGRIVDGLRKSFRQPADVRSYSIGAGEFENFFTLGVDIILNWETNEVGVFTFGASSPNGLMTPQLDILSVQKGKVFGLNTVTDYSGPFVVDGASIGPPELPLTLTGNAFSTKDASVFGFMGGETLGFPFVEFHSYEANYSPLFHEQVPREVMILIWLLDKLIP